MLGGEEPACWICERTQLAPDTAEALRVQNLLALGMSWELALEIVAWTGTRGELARRRIPSESSGASSIGSPRTNAVATTRGTMAAIRLEIQSTIRAARRSLPCRKPLMTWGKRLQLRPVRRAWSA